MQALNLEHQVPAPTMNRKQYMESPELQQLADKICSDKNIELGPTDICYLLVYPNISKKRPARVSKASGILNHYTGNHYVIQISGELWDMLDEQTRYNMMWHQILHLDPVFKSKTQEWKFNIKKPNYTDYYQISDTIGSEWHKAVQAVSSSLYDMDPKQENQVSLF